LSRRRGQATTISAFMPGAVDDRRREDGAVSLPSAWRLRQSLGDFGDLCTVGRLPDSTYHWEERPGPAPANEDNGDARTIIRIIPVAAKDGRTGS
jgi:hypothetical protein